MQFRSALSVN